MEKILYIRPYHVFTVFDKFFIYKVKSLYYSEITEEEYLLLKKLEGRYQTEYSKKTEELLYRYNIYSDETVSKEKQEEFDQTLWNAAIQKLHICSLELMVAQTCNMKCVYCYGDEGHYGKKENMLMSRETAHAAIDFLKQQIDKHQNKIDKHHNNEEEFIGIAFFGGEPLLNFSLIKDCVDYAEKKFGKGRVTFGITTNLTLITDEILDFFEKYHISPLISFDGPKEYQSAHRKLCNRKDSYDTVVPLLRKTLKRLPASAGRATMYYDEDEARIREEFRKLGFIKYDAVPVSGSFHDGIERKDKFLWYEKKALELQNGVRDLLAAIKNKQEVTVRDLLKSDNVKHTFCYGVKHHKLTKSLMSCGAGRTMAAVSTDGAIYPCHRFVGVEENCLGNLRQPDEFSRGRFEKHRITENKACQSCYLKYGCGGSCMHENACDAEDANGNKSIFIAHENYCKFEKTKLKMNAYIHASVTEDDLAWLRNRKILFLERDNN